MSDTTGQPRLLADPAAWPGQLRLLASFLLWLVVFRVPAAALTAALTLVTGATGPAIVTTVVTVLAAGVIAGRSWGQHSGLLPTDGALWRFAAAGSLVVMMVELGLVYLLLGPMGLIGPAPAGHLLVLPAVAIGFLALPLIRVAVALGARRVVGDA